MHHQRHSRLVLYQPQNDASTAKRRRLIHFRDVRRTQLLRSRELGRPCPCLLSRPAISRNGRRHGEELFDGAAGFMSRAMKGRHRVDVDFARYAPPRADFGEHFGASSFKSQHTCFQADDTLAEEESQCVECRDRCRVDAWCSH